MAQTERDMETR